jgi:CheY-like chemotaxis protein
MLAYESSSIDDARGNRRPPVPDGRSGVVPVTKRVLVVDDEPNIVELARIKLTHEGFDVATANSGAEALAAVAIERPDVIVLDVMMPGMTGWEVAHRLREDPETRDIPILMLTALGLPEEHPREFADFTEYYTKPFQPSTLAKMVRRLAEKND